MLLALIFLALTVIAARAVDPFIELRNGFVYLQGVGVSILFSPIVRASEKF